MQVIKKDGRLQELEANKIKVSILNATSETKALLNESDVNVLVKDIIKAIENLRSEYGNTSSYEITGVVVDMLKRDGFEDVVSSYIGYSKQFDDAQGKVTGGKGKSFAYSKVIRLVRLQKVGLVA